MRKKALIIGSIFGAAAFSLAVALPANADTADTVTTVSVQDGVLSTSTGTAMNLGTIAAGQTATGTAHVAVSDLRGGTVGWVTSVAATDFTSAAVPGATIPAQFLSFTTHAATTTGNVTLLASDTPGSSSPVAVQTTTSVNGNNAAEWDETVTLAVPFGTPTASDYTSTVTYSTL